MLRIQDMEKPTEGYIDSIGQPNPAIDLERKNIQEATERQEKKDKEVPAAATAAEPDEETLEEHTVEELRSIAAKEGAELHGDMLKADIVKAIKKNRKKHA